MSMIHGEEGTKLLVMADIVKTLGPSYMSLKKVASSLILPSKTR